MSYMVELATDAQQDLIAIVEYYHSKAGPGPASVWLSQIETALRSLQDQPLRGHRPHELHGIRVAKELEIIVARYRILYQIRDKTVYVIAIFDGRQDVKHHLQKRRSRLSS